MINDAYTLDIISSLRLHKTLYVGLLKWYRPATLHGLVAVRLPNLFKVSLRLLSMLQSSLSFYLGVSRLDHSFINVDLGNQDASSTLLEVPPVVNAESQVR